MNLFKTTSCRAGFVLLMLITSTCNSFADTIDAGNVLKRETDIQTLKELPNSIPDNLIEVESEKYQDNSALKILVKKFVFEGTIQSVSEHDLRSIVEVFENKNLSFSEIQSVAKKITQYYSDKGYFLASAIIPKQEVVDGVIKIIINEGTLDPAEPIRIKGNQLRLKNDVVLQYFTAAAKGNALTQSTLERSILNLNDNPGITASANLEPGNQVGTSRVVLDVNEGPLLDASVVADNFGGRYTGSDRISASVNLNNPTQYGDRLSLFALTAIEQKFDLLKLSYNVPLGRSGLRGNISYTDLQYELGKEFRNDNSIGHARNWTYAMKYPVYRNAATSLSIGGAYDWKSNFNESNNQTVSDKQIDVYNTTLTLEHVDRVFGGGFTQAQISYFNGDLDLNGFQDSARTQGRYHKTSAQLVRIQRGTQRLSFQLIANGQSAQKNLDGAEKIILGGPTGVRAYPAGEGAGDEGYRYSIDARYALATGTKLGDWVISAFYDYGKIWQYQNPNIISGVNHNAYSLEGWGLGLDMVAAGKYTVKAFWAQTLGNNPNRTTEGKDSDGTSRDSRFWLMGTVSF